eukprot:2335154-Prymnesium_polylepis.1
MSAPSLESGRQSSCSRYCVCTGRSRCMWSGSRRARLPCVVDVQDARHPQVCLAGYAVARAHRPRGVCSSLNPPAYERNDQHKTGERVSAWLVQMLAFKGSSSLSGSPPHSSKC